MLLVKLRASNLLKRTLNKLWASRAIKPGISFKPGYKKSVIVARLRYKLSTLVFQAIYVIKLLSCSG